MKSARNRRILTIVVVVLAVIIGQFLLIGLFFPDSWPGQLLRGTAIMGEGDEPTYAPATVDGNYSEWDLSYDFFSNMYEAGNPNKAVMAKLYLRYDCDSSTLYMLVLAEPGHTIDADAGTGEHFAKLGGTKLVQESDAPPDGAPPPDFAWINLSGDGKTADGWEASATLYPGSYTDFLVHSQVDDNQTSKVPEGKIKLLVDCDPTAVFLNYFLAEWAGGTGGARIGEGGETGEGGVMVRWETAAEIDNLGFNVYRGFSVEGPWTKLNGELIPSKVPPGSPVGATYEWPDSKVQPGENVFYLLEDVDTYGIITQHGPVKPK
jgi:hypothetical protein